MGKEDMLVTKQCMYCNGTGVRMVETSSLFGLIRKQVPLSCEMCSGSGETFFTPTCKYCNGQGLIGNEREICRTCNGVGHWDAFAYIPRELLRAGTLFDRRCDQCDHNRMEIASPIEEFKQVLSWESEEELRSVEICERVKVRWRKLIPPGTIALAPAHCPMSPSMACNWLPAFWGLYAASRRWPTKRPRCAVGKANVCQWRPRITTLS